jgi:hypothetical protein
VLGKCTTVIVVNWDEIGRSMTDRKFHVQSSLFRSLWSSSLLIATGLPNYSVLVLLRFCLQIWRLIERHHFTFWVFFYTKKISKGNSIIFRQKKLSTILINKSYSDLLSVSFLGTQCSPG